MPGLGSREDDPPCRDSARRRVGEKWGDGIVPPGTRQPVRTSVDTRDFEVRTRQARRQDPSGPIRRPVNTSDS
jgi:hypothetical protein